MRVDLSKAQLYWLVAMYHTLGPLRHSICFQVPLRISYCANLVQVLFNLVVERIVILNGWLDFFYDGTCCHLLVVLLIDLLMLNVSIFNLRGHQLLAGHDLFEEHLLSQQSVVDHVSG